MTLDEKILAQAKEIRSSLVDLETQTAHARIDYHASIKKLHAAGGSLREIADALELSHQRVHQIVEGPPAVPGLPPFNLRTGWTRGRGRRHGGRRQFFARFDDEARKVIVEAQSEADGLKHNYIGTEHLMLALVRRGTCGLDLYDAARKEIVAKIGEGDEAWLPGIPRPFTPRAKRVFETALKEAGEEQITPEALLIAVVEDPKGAGGEVLQALGVTAGQLRGQRGR